MPRLTIAQRLALLSAAVALVMTFAICLLSYFTNRAVLIEHELVDLGDECRLRMFELREEFRIISRHVREHTMSLPQPDSGDDLAAFVASDDFERAWRDSFTQLLDRADRHAAASPWGWVDRSIYSEAFFLSVAQDGSSTVLRAIRHRDGTVLPFDPAVEPTRARLALADLRQRVRDAHGRVTTSGQRQYESAVRAVPDEPQRQVLCVGFELPHREGKPSGMFVLAIDFTQLFANQTQRSARHLFLVMDANGTTLVHRDPERVGQPAVEDRDSTGQPRFLFKKVPWGLEPPTPAEPLPGTGELLQSGELGDGLKFQFARRDYDGESPFLDPARVAALEQALAAVAGLRYNRIRAPAREISLQARDAETLRAGMKAVTSWEKNSGVRTPATWNGPIDCQTFAAQVVPLRFGIDESSESMYLIVAASVEEMAMDIRRSTGNVLWISLLLCVGAAGLALLPAHLMTRPLKRITRAARAMAEGEYRADLPAASANEIGDLSRAFRHMAEQIGERDLALRDTVARMEAVLRTAADGVITFNERGIIEEWNQAAERIFGYRADEIKGHKVQQLMEIPPELSRADGEHESGETVRSLNRVLSTPTLVRQGRRKDGSIFWMEAAFSEVPVGDRRLTTGIFRDVTRRVEDEERIRQMNELLEARVRLRTAELQDAKGKLEVALQAAQSASRAKDVFVRTVSHELRTPLSAVKGFTELLLNPKATKLRENPVPTLQKIHAASDYLLTLINDLLDVARVSAGEQIHLNIGEFELSPFIAALVEMTNPLLKKNSNKLVLNVAENLGRMRADETRVRQVLLNLLSNACKFTEQGEVTFAATRETTATTDHIVFLVRDTGSGMTVEQMRDLFKPFYRVDNSTTRKHGGTGLGLSISKLLCDRMGGSIEVQSEPGVGTTFLVRLPTRVQETNDHETGIVRTALPPASPESTPRRGNTVLVIDDDPMSREIVQTFLQREGFEVVLARGGEEGVALAREVRPGVITLDVLMPGTDGWEVLTALKSDPLTHDIPVVMLTVADDRGRGFTLGASEFVTKPVDWERLSGILRRFSATPAPILVVDDDALQREHMVQALTLSGWKVREAADGVEALHEVDQQRPAVVLLDLMMPNMDGFQFLEELRRRPGGTEIPVVVVTAKDLNDEERQRLSVGVARVLHKGALTRNDLLTRLREEVSTHVPGGDDARRDQEATNG